MYFGDIAPPKRSFKKYPSEFGISFFVTFVPIMANSWLVSCKYWRKPDYTAEQPPDPTSLAIFSLTQAGIRTQAVVRDSVQSVAAHSTTRPSEQAPDEIITRAQKQCSFN